MTASFRNGLITVVLTLLAAFAGAWGGMWAFSARDAGDTSLHDVVHRELELTPAQDTAIARLETTFAARRRRYELEMRAANAELAAAIREEQGHGPKVDLAVSRFHRAMSALQSETIDHVFAMREVLSPEQRERFDETVVGALTDGER